MKLTTQVIFILVLLIAGLVCFLMAAFSGYGTAPDGRPVGWRRANLVALGLAFWIITQIIALF